MWIFLNDPQPPDGYAHVRITTAMERRASMDYSSAIRIPGAGGGGAGVQDWWDCKLSLGIPLNISFGASPRASSLKFSNGFSQTSGKMLLCLMILVLHVPGLVNCGECLFLSLPSILAVSSYRWKWYQINNCNIAYTLFAVVFIVIQKV